MFIVLCKLVVDRPAIWGHPDGVHEYQFFYGSYELSSPSIY